MAGVGGGRYRRGTGTGTGTVREQQIKVKIDECLFGRSTQKSGPTHFDLSV